MEFHTEYMKVLVAQLCPTLCDPVGCSPPESTVHGILQARILEWVAISFSRGSSWPRDWTPVSCIAGRFFTIWATREVLQSTSYISGFFLRSIHVVRLGRFHCWVVFNCMGILQCVLSIFLSLVWTSSVGLLWTKLLSTFLFNFVYRCIFLFFGANTGVCYWVIW